MERKEKNAEDNGIYRVIKPVGFRSVECEKGDHPRCVPTGKPLQQSPDDDSVGEEIT